MPRHYAMGGRASAPGAGGSAPAGGAIGDRTLRERFGALRNVPPFLKLVWATNPALTAATLALRFIRALLPVATLFVGKLIIDEVVLRATTPGAPSTLGGWLTSDLLDRLLWLLAAEFALAVLSDLLGRLMTQLSGQAQDIVTIIAFAAGLVVYAPWLILLLIIALVPAFLGESHFNAQSYALTYARTPEQREIDYIRQIGASAENAKEVKIF